MITIHGVLAAAYRGASRPRSASGAPWLAAGVEPKMHTHASQDDGETALCGRVRAGHLADANATPGAELTCPTCLARVKRIERTGGT